MVVRKRGIGWWKGMVRMVPGLDAIIGVLITRWYSSAVRLYARKCQGGSYLCLSDESETMGSLSLTSRLPSRVPSTFRMVSLYSRVLFSVHLALHRRIHTLHCV